MRVYMSEWNIFTDFFISVRNAVERNTLYHLRTSLIDEWWTDDEPSELMFADVVDQVRVKFV